MNNTKKSSNALVDKSYELALGLSKLILSKKNSYSEEVFTRQLLRSVTSIGANIQEAQGCESKNDFLSKLSIAYKESLETKYWLRLSLDTKIFKSSEIQEFLNLCEEVIKMLAKSRITIKNSINDKKK